MKKAIAIFVSLLCAAGMTLTFTACGGGSGNYKDGTYEGRSQIHTNDEEEGSGDGYGVVNITIKDNKITACTFKTYEEDGTLKDSNYGKVRGQVANADYYNKAQKALKAADEYAKQLVEAGSLDGVDAISGATINFEEFNEAVQDALDKAEE